MNVIQSLTSQRESLDRQIAELSADLRDVVTAIAAIKKSHESGADTRDAAPRPKAYPQKMPINEAVLRAVANGRKTPQNILAFIQKDLSMTTTLMSVRTRLSRLKNDGKVSLNGSGWIPVTRPTSKTATEFPQLPQ